MCSYVIHAQPNDATLQFNVEYVFISGTGTNGSASIVIANSNAPTTPIFKYVVSLIILELR